MRDSHSAGGDSVPGQPLGGDTLQTGGAPATSGDAPHTLRPRDTRDLADMVRNASHTNTPLRIIGAGTWLHAGRPVTAHHRLDLSALTGIVDYVPGDLTITARAATPLAVLQAAIRAEGQWLPLDPVSAPAATYGATLATASSGPLAASIGLPRDLALGVEFVSGTGELLRGGGRVVKNVAGFDLVRLQVGAWGTLGVLTEATVRLRALPETDRTIGIEAHHGTPNTLATQLERIRHLQGGVLAAELLSAPLAASLQLPNRDVLVIRLAGNADAVRAQVADLSRLGEVHELSPDVWARLADATRDVATTVVRWSAPPARLAALWTEALRTLPSPVTAHASLARGIVRIALDHTAPPPAPAGARVIVERTTAGAWPPMPGGATARLSQRMRDAFDPQRVLNPGIFGNP